MYFRCSCSLSCSCGCSWNCYKILTLCSLLTTCRIPRACHAKRHLDVHKCSEPVKFLHFWHRNVLRATTACTFSTSQLPKVFRRWCVLYILTSECAWRHNGVQLLIAHLARWLRAHRFSEPTFRPSGATLEKHSVSRLCYLFAHLHLLSSDSFSSLIFSLLLFSSLLWLFPPLLFHLSILSEDVGSLTSKLPSIILMNHIMGESSIGGRDWTMFPLHGRTTPRVQLTALPCRFRKIAPSPSRRSKKSFVR